MDAPSPGCPADFTLIVHDTLSDGFEMSKVLLATAGFDGSLRLLTSGWERTLGYGRGELKGKTLGTLLGSAHAADAAAAAILERQSMQPVDLRLRCRNGTCRLFRLHRRYDKHERLMYLVAEEISAERRGAVRERADRRACARCA